MLKTITKFVLQRRRRVQQVPQQVIEEDDTRDPASASEDLTQPAEPQVDEPSSQPVLAKVKWYNPDKRYGFVTLSDGSGDAFLHATALAGMGIRTLEASVQEMGTVKWYNATKGFGFIVRDSGGNDVFLHASVLERAGITSLSEGQRVFIGIAKGRKGPEAASI